MPFYLMRFSYTPEARARLIKRPEDRREVGRAVIEKLGGKLHGFWYAFGEHDACASRIPRLDAPGRSARSRWTV